MELKEIYNKVSHVVEKHIQLNKEAMACLQSMGFNGFKRMHRYNAEWLFCKQLKLANILFNMKREKLDLKPVSMVSDYMPMSIKDHLAKWDAEIEYSLKELGELNKAHFEKVGCTSCIIEKVICQMLDDHGNIQRWYYRGEDGDWLMHDMFMLDKYIHEKYKEKEKELK